MVGKAANRVRMVLSQRFLSAFQRALELALHLKRKRQAVDASH